MLEQSHRFQFTSIAFSAGIMISWGFLAMATVLGVGSALLGNASLSLRVWGESAMMVALGSVMILSAFLTGSPRTTRVEMGGVIGAFVALISVIVAMDLLQEASYAVQLTYLQGTYFVWLEVGFPIVLFAGFPMGLIGSLRAIRDSLDVETERDNKGMAPSGSDATAQ